MHRKTYKPARNSGEQEMPGRYRAQAVLDSRIRSPPDFCVPKIRRKDKDIRFFLICKNHICFNFRTQL